MREREAVPGIEVLTTEAARDLLTRPVFPGYYVEDNRGRYLGSHVAVNGYDLERVEKEAFERGVQSVPKLARAKVPA